MKNLEEYLTQAIRDGNLHHTLSIVYQAEDAGNLGFTGVGFILHPSGVGGETVSFLVRGNQLRAAEHLQSDGTVLIDYGLAVAIALREEEVGD